MHVIKAIAHSRRSPLRQWVRRANALLPPVVASVLVLVLAYNLGKLTWSFLPHYSFDFPARRINQVAETALSFNEPDYSELIGADLFGPAPHEAAVPISMDAKLEAPETMLSLTLTGVIDDSTGLLSQAIIVGPSGEQHPYMVGAEIEGGSGAILRTIYCDRVILVRNGRFETLRLSESDERAALVGRTKGSRQIPVSSPPFSAPLSFIGDKAMLILRVMQMIPHRQGSNVIGFRINPGQEEAIFQSLGFKPNDVVTEINGVVLVVLDDTSRTLVVLDLLTESSQAQVTVIRDGRPVVLIVDTTKLQVFVSDSE